MLEPISPLSGYDQDFNGMRLWERPELALVSLAIPLGGLTTAKKALKSAYKLALTDVGMSGATPSHRIIRTSPDQAMLVFESDSALAEPDVHSALKGAFYTTNQTDAWAALAIEGANVRDVLERICPLDLHPEAFPPDRADRTVMEHLGVFIIREGSDRFLLLSASSSAKSFLHAVETSIHYVI